MQVHSGGENINRGWVPTHKVQHGGGVTKKGTGLEGGGGGGRSRDSLCADGLVFLFWVVKRRSEDRAAENGVGEPAGAHRSLYDFLSA